MIGETIKALRKQNGLTQTQFADKLNERYNLNIERSMVSKWETGTQSPMIYTVGCIASFFGVSIDFLTGAEKKPPETDGTSFLDGLTKEELQSVKNFVAFVKSQRNQ